jgi:hypothetical protein
MECYQTHSNEASIITLIPKPGKYVPKIGVHNFIKQTLLTIEAQKNLSTIIMGDVTIPLSPIERSSINTNGPLTSLENRKGRNSTKLIL